MASAHGGPCPYDMFDVGVGHGGPRGGVAPDGPAVENDVAGREAEGMERVLHHHVNGRLLLGRERHALKGGGY